jgi:hypothetical protein
MQPVAHMGAVAVQRHGPALEQRGDEARDDLLGELVRPAVVRAPLFEQRVTITGSPCVTAYARANRSLPAFDAEYGELGARGCCSSQLPSAMEP